MEQINIEKDLEVLEKKIKQYEEQYEQTKKLLSEAKQEYKKKLDFKKEYDALLSKYKDINVTSTGKRKGRKKIEKQTADEESVKQLHELETEEVH